MFLKQLDCSASESLGHRTPGIFLFGKVRGTVRKEASQPTPSWRLGIDWMIGLGPEHFLSAP